MTQPGLHTPRREEGPQQEAGPAAHRPAQWGPHLGPFRKSSSHDTQLDLDGLSSMEEAGALVPPVLQNDSSQPCSHPWPHQGHSLEFLDPLWLLLRTQQLRGQRTNLLRKKKLALLSPPHPSQPTTQHTQNPGSTDMLFLETGSNVNFFLVCTEKNSPERGCP